MKKLVSLFMIVSLLAALFPAVVSAEPLSPPPVLRAKLIAGQTNYIGTVTVWYEDGALHVKYRTFPGFCLTETHLHVADSLDGIPQKNGNPIPGQFDYKDDLDCVRMKEYIISMDWTATTNLIIAAHAVVAGPDGFEETAWGVRCGKIDVYGFPGKNWAAYITYPNAQIDTTSIPARSSGDARAQESTQ